MFGIPDVSGQTFLGATILVLGSVLVISSFPTLLNLVRGG